MRALPRLLLLLACLPFASALAADPPAQPRNKGEAREMFSADGLAKAAIKGIDVAYLRPDARLSEYRSVLVRPVSVSLRRDWARSSAMPSLRPRAEDVERIRNRVATYVREEFEKELADAGITQVQAPGDDVLEIDLSIVDLFAAAPDVQKTGQSDVYALSAGEMTLVGELRDSVSGETQFRFYDHGEARKWMRPRRILFNQNEGEARMIARDWAKALLEGLQAARAAN